MADHDTISVIVVGIANLMVCGLAAAAVSPPPAADGSVVKDDRFQRAAQSVADCKKAVKELAKEANSCKSFREKCSNVLGAALGASLALQEVTTPTACVVAMSSLSLAADWSLV